MPQNNSLYQPQRPGYSLEYPAMQPNPQFAGDFGPHNVPLKSVQKFKSDRGLGLDDFKATQAGAMTGNPYIAAAGLGLDVLGKGVELYGAAQERKNAEAEAKAAERRYEMELARMNRLDREREEQQRRINELTYGDYATGIQNKAQELYATK